MENINMHPYMHHPANVHPNVPKPMMHHVHKPVELDVYNVNVHYVPPAPVSAVPAALPVVPTPAVSILVLFILLVIITRTIFPGVAVK